MATKDEDVARRKAIAEYLEKKRLHELLTLQVRGAREALQNKKRDHAKRKDDLKSRQSVGQSSGEMPRPQDNKPCKEAPRSKKKDCAKRKGDNKSLQSVGQSSTGEVLRPQGNKQLTKKLQNSKNDHAKIEDDLKSLQITGQSTEVQRPLDSEPCGAEKQAGEETEGGQEARVKSSSQC